MTTEHNEVETELAYMLRRQLDPRCTGSDPTRGGPEADHLLRPGCVRRSRELDRKSPGTGALEVFEEPLPLVVEVWSKSTGDYDVEEKLVEYRRRGDRRSGGSIRMRRR